MKLFAICLLLLPCAFAWQEPWFCHGIDCPEFTGKNVTINNTVVEFRSYPAFNWSSTDLLDTEYSTASQTTFMRLFDYISGQNVKKEKVKMTAPVHMKITPGQGPFCKSNFTTSFFIPYALQSDAPTPSASNVYLQTFKPMHVAVLSFGGFANQQLITDHVSTLGGLLQMANMNFDTSHYVYAGYDSPFRLFNRHNEVWLVLSD